MKKNNTSHAQHIINIIDDTTGKIVARVYNRREAAEWLSQCFAAPQRWSDLSMVDRIFNHIKQAFSNGGTVCVPIPGYRVVKTERRSPWRGKHYRRHVMEAEKTRRERLMRAYEGGGITVIVWRR